MHEAQNNTDAKLRAARLRHAEENREAMHIKYAEAVKLYAETNMMLKDIAQQCGLSRGALGQYLRRYQRELVLKRHNVDAGGADPKQIKLITAGKQSMTAHEKYKNAVAACDSISYIKYNVSQVARCFGLDGTSLANFMRIHYDEVLVRRELIRQKMGLADNTPRGARKKVQEQYADAVELYRSTDLTLPEVAERCNVSECGLSQHLRFYHKDVMKKKEQQRREALTVASKERGAMLGNGRKNQPSQRVEQQYAEALTLYRDTRLTLQDIATRTGVSKEGFRFYLNKWHKPLVAERARQRTAGQTKTNGADDTLDKKRNEAAAQRYLLRL